MTENERPGVYTTYSVSGTRYSAEQSAVAGVAAMAGLGESGALYTVTSYEQAADNFGEQSNLTKLIKILFANKVTEVRAVPILTEGALAYKKAITALCRDKDVKAIVCDNDTEQIVQAMKTTILTSDMICAHKIAVVEAQSETAAGYVTAAENINCERVVLAAPKALDENGQPAVCGSLAAAVCGALLSTRDPAVPLNGAQLYGLGGLTNRYFDSDINSLVRGGVTPCEHLGGTTSVIRGITTRSHNDGTKDKTWREITTVMIVDDVIPTVRDALKNSFSRAKNTAQTRGAIRTKTIIELEKKVAAEIIESYDNVTVTADDSDPTICNVSFDFTVAHGLNQICLSAFITV